MKEKRKQLLSEIQQIVELTLLFAGKLVNEVGSHSFHPLTNLFGSKRPNAVKTKCEDHAIFIAQTNVEGEVLRGNHAALPGVADGRS